MTLENLEITPIEIPEGLTPRERELYAQGVKKGVQFSQNQVAYTSRSLATALPSDVISGINRALNDLRASISEGKVPKSALPPPAPPPPTPKRS